MTGFRTDEISKSTLMRAAERLKKMQKKTAESIPAVETDDLLEHKDTISLNISNPTVKPAANPWTATSSITPADMEKYKKILMQMSDIRPEEIKRVEGVLNDDGYGEEALNVVVDRLLTNP